MADLGERSQVLCIMRFVYVYAFRLRLSSVHVFSSATAYVQTSLLFIKLLMLFKKRFCYGILP